MGHKRLLGVYTPQLNEGDKMNITKNYATCKPASAKLINFIDIDNSNIVLRWVKYYLEYLNKFSYTAPFLNTVQVFKEGR